MKPNPKERLRELLADIPMDRAEREAAERGVERMSDGQAETFVQRIEFVNAATVIIIDEMDRLFGPESPKGEKR